MNNKYTLKSLCEQYDKIEIPIIQRDYAQGRENETKVRSKFVEFITNSFSTHKAEELDFVYGNLNSDGEFIPLDGQQRLTTLFLLHYYLSIHDNQFANFKSVFATQENHSRFLYQTRLSSTDFCNALINNPISLPTDNTEKISENILHKYPWFSDSWKYIQEDCNSLCRHSNLGILLNSLSE
jgi:uncharacterized protein with ParB-like and HNH nuclease domain